MDLSGFDFNAFRTLLNSLSEEEAASLSQMAGNMMDSLQQKAVQEAEEEPQNWMEYLHVDEHFAQAFSGRVLDALEAAADMEQFYEDIEGADYSASVLYYAKAVLLVLREKLAPLFARKMHKTNFDHPEQTTLFHYIQELSYSPDIRDLTAVTGIPVTTWQMLGSKLMEVFVLLQRAEYDRVSLDELQSLKDLILRRELLRSVAEWNPDLFLESCLHRGAAS